MSQTDKFAARSLIARQAARLNLTLLLPKIRYKALCMPTFLDIHIHLVNLQRKTIPPPQTL